MRLRFHERRNTKEAIVGKQADGYSQHQADLYRESQTDLYQEYQAELEHERQEELARLATEDIRATRGAAREKVRRCALIGGAAQDSLHACQEIVYRLES